MRSQIKIAQVLTLLFLLTSCTQYQVRPVNALFVKPHTQWGVFKNDYVIPEFTRIGSEDYAKNRQDAEELFNLRKVGVEPFIPLKYESNRKGTTLFYYPVFALCSIVAFPMDIVTLPIYAAVHQYYKHKDPIYDANVKFEWFPLTRFGFYELFYGPSNWFPLFGDSTPFVKQDWDENEVAQKKLDEYLKRTEKEFRKL